MKYNGHNLKEVLESHELWVKTRRERGSCAVFENVTLKNESFYYNILDGASFSEVKFIDCGLDQTKFDNRFDNVIFQNCSIEKCHFDGSIFETCQFINCDLGYVSFNHTHFLRTKFCQKREKEAFRGSSFHDITFGNSTLVDVAFKNVLCEIKTFYHVDLSRVSFEDAYDIIYSYACPDEGSFIAFKKVWRTNLKQHCIAKLLIPEDAKRSSANAYKCRSDKAIVLELQDLEGNILEDKVAISNYDPDFKYVVGETVHCENDFEENHWIECASGIHFFTSREMARKYHLS